MSVESTAIHRRVPKLPVSPSRSPSSARMNVKAAHVDCTLWDAEETTTIELYDAYREDAGSNVAAGLRGPKVGVHLTTAPRDEVPCRQCRIQSTNAFTRSRRLVRRRQEIMERPADGNTMETLGELHRGRWQSTGH